MSDDGPTSTPRRSRRTGEELPPAELRALARERSEARRAQDWAEADRLRATIEAQGWKVIDKGAEGRLARAHPQDAVEADGQTRYGWSGAVPAYDGSRNHHAPTIVARATADPVETALFIASLTHADDGSHVLIVAGDAAMLPADTGDAEVVRILGEATAGVALAIAIRRARGEHVVVGEGWPVEATADRVARLLACLDDPTVGVAGWWGVVSTDLRAIEPAAMPGGPTHADASPGDPMHADASPGDPMRADPVAVAWHGLAFRTRDGIERGPVDEQFADPTMLATWWSLVLRDEGPDMPARTARAVLDAMDPAMPTDGRELGARELGARERGTKRDRYRIIDRFGRRSDLLTDPNTGDRPAAPR